MSLKNNFGNPDFQIAKAVIMHEAALKAQAKKMNVASLRSNADQQQVSAEIRIAKVYFYIYR